MFLNVRRKKKIFWWINGYNGIKWILIFLCIPKWMKNWEKQQQKILFSSRSERKSRKINSTSCSISGKFIYFFSNFFLCFKFSSPHIKENVSKTAKNGPKSENLNQGKVEKSEMKSWGKIPRHGNINLIVKLKQKRRKFSPHFPSSLIK